MFVQYAHEMTTSDGTITFHGLAHSTLFFADRLHYGLRPHAYQTSGAGDVALKPDAE